MSDCINDAIAIFKRLKRVENFLWHGLVNDAIAELNQLTKKYAKNFQNYLAFTSFSNSRLLTLSIFGYLYRVES